MRLTTKELPQARPVDSLSRRRTVLTGALLTATLIYFLTELIVARQWPRPYSWTDNMISDLGVPECLGDLSRDGGLAVSDRFVCSPWHPLMNTAFVTVGALGIAAAIAVRPLLPRPWDRAAVALATINGVALACVGIFPGSAGEFPGGPGTRIVVHPIAAYVEHVSGMALMALAATVLLRSRPRLALFTTACIAISGLAALVIPWANPLGAGGTERAAIDPFLWWRCVLGVAVLVVAQRVRPRPPVEPDLPCALNPTSPGRPAAPPGRSSR
ncbi:DUF998 domain-containing protein [Tsukamurella ocularis]|uniref:DUF998 domain-containing protein n=1 Tax=Tsukamurella ocularis TaxID=1970234 RepID=UPI002167768A|nr:DUF998 domain-containing protein [Tsukamurella ocularis]MCS3779682.1 putative membrane protein [Tsukamurella ocularis]MCS3788918.1 putative membrane protein [Tsukamurella ocularis]MCS3850128.1 putative membrane protein [Tsukamurella ocularis]